MLILYFNSDTISTISTLDSYLKKVACTEIIGLVIYDLPGRDCAAKASNGELPVGSVSRYKSEYIDREFPSLLFNSTSLSLCRKNSHRQNHQGESQHCYCGHHR